MRDIIFSQHALDQMEDRGTSRSEVELAIAEGERLPAKHGRVMFRKNFNFESTWKGKFYRDKQVVPIVLEEGSRAIVITAYVFYFGGKS